MITKDSIREIQEAGYCILRGRLPKRVIEECRDAFWPLLEAYVRSHEPDRGPNRYYVPVPFEPPCFAPEFFFDPEILSVVRGVMGDRIVADQWGCDMPIRGSGYQQVHVDYRRPLFEELPDLLLPAYILVVSFGLAPVTSESGPIEIAPGRIACRDPKPFVPWNPGKSV